MALDPNVWRRPASADLSQADTVFRCCVAAAFVGCRCLAADCGHDAENDRLTVEIAAQGNILDRSREARLREKLPGSR